MKISAPKRRQHLNGKRVWKRKTIGNIQKKNPGRKTEKNTWKIII
jgi:hypothetical protein